MENTLAKTILSQIQVQDKFALMAWGFKNPVALKNGIQFSISTPLYPKGVKLIVTLNSMDTYDIEVIRIHGLEVKILETSQGIYADMLIESIDELIEKDKKSIVFI